MFNELTAWWSKKNVKKLAIKLNECAKFDLLSFDLGLGRCEEPGVFTSMRLLLFDIHTHTPTVMVWFGAVFRKQQRRKKPTCQMINYRYFVELPSPTLNTFSFRMDMAWPWTRPATFFHTSNLFACPSAHENEKPIVYDFLALFGTYNFCVVNFHESFCQVNIDTSTHRALVLVPYGEYWIGTNERHEIGQTIRTRECTRKGDSKVKRKNRTNTIQIIYDAKMMQNSSIVSFEWNGFVEKTN